MAQIKKYFNLFLVVLFLGLIASLYFLYAKNKKLTSSITILNSNEKAFIAENSNLKNKAVVFQFKIEQLSYLNDSLIDKMEEVRKDLKIKDSQIKQMGYTLSQISKKDTIVFRDTIFKKSVVRIDTLLKSKWYQLNMTLKYPNTIITNPIFTSEKYIILHYNKETIEPEKKLFILRWFQKKHTILNIDVVEKNPYIKTKQNKFIEIIK